MPNIILPDYTSYSLPALVDGREQIQWALDMGHAGDAANNMWRECLRRIDEQLFTCGFYTDNTDDAYEEALNDREWVQREKNWSDALNELATPALHDMLRHAESLLADPPPAWTPYQHGAGYIWAERLRCELVARENEGATV